MKVFHEESLFCLPNQLPLQYHIFSSTPQKYPILAAMQGKIFFLPSFFKMQSIMRPLPASFTVPQKFCRAYVLSDKSHPTDQQLCHALLLHRYMPFGWAPPSARSGSVLRCLCFAKHATHKATSPTLSYQLSLGSSLLSIKVSFWISLFGLRPRLRYVLYSRELTWKGLAAWNLSLHLDEKRGRS